MKEDFTLTIVLEESEDNDQNWASLHQCLLMLFDSPLNHAGHLEVFIRLKDGRVIKMHREVRIPRTYKRFDQLFNNFLQGCDMPIVQTNNGPARLLVFIKRQLSMNCKRIRIGNLVPKFRNVDSFASSCGNSERLAVHIEFGPVDYNDLEVKTINSNEDIYSISRYPLSPALICAKITTSFEKALEVL